jgi:hypothetical protein
VEDEVCVKRDLTHIYPTHNVKLAEFKATIDAPATGLSPTELADATARNLEQIYSSSVKNTGKTLFEYIYNAWHEIPECIARDVWSLELLAGLLLGFISSIALAYVIFYHLGSLPSFLRYAKAIHYYYPRYFSLVSAIFYICNKFLHRIGWYDSKPTFWKKILKYGVTLPLLVLSEWKFWPSIVTFAYFSVKFVNKHLVHGLYMSLGPTGFGDEGCEIAETIPLRYTFHVFKVPFDTIDPFCWPVLCTVIIGAVIGVLVGGTIGGVTGYRNCLYDNAAYLLLLEVRILSDLRITTEFKKKGVNLYCYSREVHEIITKYLPRTARRYAATRIGYNNVFRRHRRILALGIILLVNIVVALVHPITDRHTAMLGGELTFLHYPKRRLWSRWDLLYEFDVLRADIIMLRRKIYFYLKFMPKSEWGNIKLCNDYENLRLLLEKIIQLHEKYTAQTGKKFDKYEWLFQPEPAEVDWSTLFVYSFDDEDWWDDFWKTDE